MLELVNCPHCQVVCQVAREHFGKQVRCFQCGKVFVCSPPTPQGAVVQPLPDHRLEIGRATTVGLQRTRNEDAYLIDHRSWSQRGRPFEIALLAVADGMGGYAGGDVAAALTVRTFAAKLAPLIDGVVANPSPETVALRPADALLAAIEEANHIVFQQARTDTTCHGMAATAAVVLVWDDQAWIGHVGDCRVYQHHAGKLTQLTRDQTLVSRMVELGQLSAKEALTHPARNQVGEAIGKQPTVRPASYQTTLAAGDWLIIASDGLHTHVEDVALQERVGQADGAEKLAHELVELANQGGGSDNCTVVVTHLGSSEVGR